ncbi:MAG TPA: PASTA domain-containing protein, partial [Candidatus Limnocylindrales bacterium]|nr:PASTA domain-containing protein [Candidatus Limnocylindrales bacterium]
TVPALLAVLIVLGSGLRGSSGGPGGGTPVPSPTLQVGMVRVPSTIGLSEADAEAAAREAGLNWRIEWRIVAGQQPGIYDQEPAAGQVVEAGSRFVMYAYRNR